MAKKQKEMDPQTLEILSSIAQIIDGGVGTEKASGKSPAKATKKSKPAAKKAPVKKPVVKPALAKKSAVKHAAKTPKVQQEEDVLVLTEVAPEEAPEKVAKVIQMPTPKEEDKGSEDVVEILVEKTPIGADDLDMDDALEELVRDMLKEKLQDYLDQHLSEIVKKVAAEELAKMRKKD